MKKLLFLALSLGGLAWAGCSKKGVDASSIPTVSVTTDQLPTEAKATLNAIKGYTVASSTKFSRATDRGSLYESRLIASMRAVASSIEIEFDINGLWTDVEAENGEIPYETIESLLHFPAKIVEYIKANRLRVEEIERKSYGFKVETTDNKKFYFDKMGKLISNKEPESPSMASESTTVEAALKFTEAHFPGYKILYANKEREDGTIHHKFYIQKSYNEGYKLEYREPATLVEIEGDEDGRVFIPKSALEAFLPSVAVSYLVNERLIDFISSAKLERNHYEVEAGNYELKFSHTGELIKRQRD